MNDSLKFQKLLFRKMFLMNLTASEKTNTLDKFQKTVIQVYGDDVVAMTEYYSAIADKMSQNKEKYQDLFVQIDDYMFDTFRKSKLEYFMINAR